MSELMEEEKVFPLRKYLPEWLIIHVKKYIFVELVGLTDETHP